MLTAEQAQEYALPRTPIKSTDKRKAGFERLHDIGATELDALEALHPGELRNILVEAIEPYRDQDIEQELEDAGSEAQDSLTRQSLRYGSTTRILYQSLRNMSKRFRPAIR